MAVCSPCNSRAASGRPFLYTPCGARGGGRRRRETPGQLGQNSQTRSPREMTVYSARPRASLLGQATASQATMAMGIVRVAPTASLRISASAASLAGLPQVPD